MTETRSQMLEAKDQFGEMLRTSLPFMGLLLFLMLLGELWISFSVPLVFLGAVLGCAYALLNLWLLFTMLAPYFFRQQNGIYILYAGLISFGVGALLMLIASVMGPRWAIGLALGIASPAVVGTLYSLQSMTTTSKT